MTLSAEQVQMIHVIGATFRSRNNMVNGQIGDLKVRLAAIAMTTLLAVELFFVAGIVVPEHLANIHTLRDIGTVDYGLMCHHPSFISKAGGDQFRSFVGYIYPHPFAAFILCRNTGRWAAAERVQNCITGVTAGKNDTSQQFCWLLCWVTDALTFRYVCS